MVNSGGQSPFENTARVLRARLDREAKLILATLSDGMRVAPHGAVSYPEWSIPQLAERTGYSVSTVQRRLKVLERAQLVRRLTRPGRSYVFMVLVNQLPLSMAAAAQQPPLLPDAETLEFRASPPPAVRGARGRFVAVVAGSDAARDPEKSIGLFHNSGQSDRTSVENLTGVHAETSTFGERGPVSVTGHPGQSDRTPRSERPDLAGDLRNVQIQITDQNAHDLSAPAHAGTHIPEIQNSEQPQLPTWGVPMTDEQRRAATRKPGVDRGRGPNYGPILAIALHLGRDPLEAQKYMAVPIAEQGDLVEATKRACAQSAMRYDVLTKEGEGVLHEAVDVAWRILVRSGVIRERSALEEYARGRRRRRHQR